MLSDYIKYPSVFRKEKWDINLARTILEDTGQVLTYNSERQDVGEKCFLVYLFLLNCSDFKETCSLDYSTREMLSYIASQPQFREKLHFYFLCFNFFAGEETFILTHNKQRIWKSSMAFHPSKQLSSYEPLHPYPTVTSYGLNFDLIKRPHKFNFDFKIDLLKIATPFIDEVCHSFMTKGKWTNPRDREVPKDKILNIHNFQKPPFEDIYYTRDTLDQLTKFRHFLFGAPNYEAKVLIMDEFEARLKRHAYDLILNQNYNL